MITPSPLCAPAVRAGMCRLALFLAFACVFVGVPAQVDASERPSARRVLSLDGTWQIGEGTMEQLPAQFDHTVPVPGLVSLATPAFTPAPGPVVANRSKPTTVDPAREAFWYRRTFRLDGPVPAVARLKVSKAMFGTRVILNGHVLGDHAPNVTPGYFDARAALRSGDNDLVIRVGANLAAVPKGVPTLKDQEKQRYIPGIFDSVELILSGTPYFAHVQTVPDIAAGRVRVQATLRNDAAADARTDVNLVVREAKSGRIVGRANQAAVTCAAGAETVVDLTVPIADCHLWSPEDPFLYRLEADSGTDQFATRFGMREFKFDAVTHHALLNGQEYFMRGSNFTLYRFFEDPDCADLPWRADWVRLLHQRVKEMRWNCLRYCIGFPPEKWYDVADELGILIQDEFPIWSIGEIEPGELAREYTEWMQERWNHPCVVVWDAQNETRSEITAQATATVRHLDLSRRPWDNGYATPVDAGDSLELHPYHYHNAKFTLADLAHSDPVPQAGPQKNNRTHAVIINEYGWLWLNRDGSPTTLTTQLYHNLLGDQSTVAQRRHVYATCLAADTEFWRSYRNAAAVMHFTTLGYSRSDGQTSDHWLDVKTLEWEPEFHRYVRDAFAPTGLMLAFWNPTAVAGAEAKIPVRLVNDLAEPWRGRVTLRLHREGETAALVELHRDASMAARGQAELEYQFTWPDAVGRCVLEAELPGDDGRPVRSVRDVQLLPGDAPRPRLPGGSGGPALPQNHARVRQRRGRARPLGAPVWRS